MSKIHPDRHHGYPNVQKVNASVTSIINELFKFKQDQTEKRYQVHNLHFFTWKSDKREHEEIFYKLIHNTPFDFISGKSSLNLFKTAQIPVDFSVLQFFDNQSQDNGKVSKSNEPVSKNIYEGIKKLCFDLDRDLSDFDILEIRDFFRNRPYIQFDNDLSGDISRILRIGTFLLHIIGSFEVRIGNKMPIIIISNRYNFPEYADGIILLPLSSDFKGAYFQIYFDSLYKYQLFYLLLDIVTIFKTVELSSSE